jgi:hypothetical protein
LGKQLAKVIQKEMDNTISGDGHDASTAGLLAFYRKMVQD